MIRLYAGFVFLVSLNFPSKIRSNVRIQLKKQNYKWVKRGIIKSNLVTSVPKSVSEQLCARFTVHVCVSECNSRKYAHLKRPIWPS